MSEETIAEVEQDVLFGIDIHLNSGGVIHEVIYEDEASGMEAADEFAKAIAEKFRGQQRWTVIGGTALFTGAVSAIEVTEKKG